MKHPFLVLGLSGVLMAAGCTPSADEGGRASGGGSPPVAPASTASAGGVGNLAAPPPVPPPEAAAPTPAAAEATPAAAAPAAAEANLSADAALAMLNNAVEYYTRALQTRVPADEEEAKTFKPVPPLTDLKQLVEYRIIRAIPAAPAGKKFVYDAKSGQVKLVSQ